MANLRASIDQASKFTPGNMEGNVIFSETFVASRSIGSTEFIQVPNFRWSSHLMTANDRESLQVDPPAAA